MPSKRAIVANAAPSFHIRPTQSPPRRSNPGHDQFDSLQQLLEDAGYRDTRVFTPLHDKAPASPPEVCKPVSGLNASTSSTTMRSTHPSSSQSQRKMDVTQITYDDQSVANNIDQVKSVASSSSWFQAPWPSSASETKGREVRRARHKQSEPVLKKKSSLSSWASSWWSASSDATETPVNSPPHEQDTPTEQRHPSPARERPALRHTSSTHSLWQASMKHHRDAEAQAKAAPETKTLPRMKSFPARQPSSRTTNSASSISRKVSFDGARIVAGVGVQAASAGFVSEEVILPPRGERRVSLRQAFVEHDVAERSSDGAESESISTLERRDSLGSLDLSMIDGPALPTIANQSGTDTPLSSPVVANDNPLLPFSSLAEPLLSTGDAVAMRNSACLDTVSLDGLATGPGDDRSERRIRKMRSVDALEFALERMRASEAAGRQRRVEPVIPESSSTGSLRVEDFANARTTHDDGSPASITRCATPTLVITSPTGVRPPQPLILDGVEFEPWSVSPDGKMTSKLVRPTPQRTSWRLRQRSSGTKGDKEGGEPSPTAQQMAAPAEHPVQAGKARKETGQATQNVAHLSTPRLRRRSRSRSSGSLRNGAAEQSGSDVKVEAIKASSIGTLSGSAQVRALQRDVLKRTKASSTRSCQEERVAVSPSPSAPRPLDPHSEDDPFIDFSEIQKKGKSAPSSSTLNGTGGDNIDRSQMSPVPFERTSRSSSPLGENRAAANASQAQPVAPSNTKSGTKATQRTRTLSNKRSGVGLACLVDLDQQRAGLKFNASVNVKVAPKPSHVSCNKTQTAADNDENAYPLLDSPTANAAVHRLRRKRSAALQTGNQVSVP